MGGDYNYTALMWSVVRDQPPDVVQELLDAGADASLERINAWGRNAMFIAAWENRTAHMELMLASGANATSVADHDHWGALHKTCEMGNIAQLEMLLAAGADIEAPTKPDKENPDGRTCLSLAQELVEKKPELGRQTLALVEAAIAQK